MCCVSHTSKESCVYVGMKRFRSQMASSTYTFVFFASTDVRKRTTYSSVTSFHGVVELSFVSPPRTVASDHSGICYKENSCGQKEGEYRLKC